MKTYDPNDWKDHIDIVDNLIKNFEGHEKAIAFLLMSIGNITKHLYTKISVEEFNEIMKSDTVSRIGAGYAEKFMEAGDVLLKKYGFRRSE